MTQPNRRTKPEQSGNKLNRRQLLYSAGIAASCLPILGILGCGGGGSSSGSSTMSNASTAAATGSAANTTTESNSSATAASQWLTGGTAAMEAEFPPASDPIDISLGNVICTVVGTNSYTIGPCYFDVDDMRLDISEGQQGIPMTLAFKLLDENCDPIANATIEVWWCNWEGIYSADNSDSSGRVSNFNVSFCSDNDSEALVSKWFRGIQSTDGDGNVYFLGCFPGWYPGRTTHIHVRVVTSSKTLVTQFCFEDDLANDIYLNNSDYTGSAKDTTNNRDSVFGSEVDDYAFVVQQQFDGSMLAYKAIQLI